MVWRSQRTYEWERRNVHCILVQFHLCVTNIFAHDGTFTRTEQRPDVHAVGLADSSSVASNAVAHCRCMPRGLVVELRLHFNRP